MYPHPTLYQWSEHHSSHCLPFPCHSALCPHSPLCLACPVQQRQKLTLFGRVSCCPLRMPPFTSMNPGLLLRLSGSLLSLSLRSSPHLPLSRAFSQPVPATVSRWSQQLGATPAHTLSRERKVGLAFACPFLCRKKKSFPGNCLASRTSHAFCLCPLQREKGHWIGLDSLGPVLCTRRWCLQRKLRPCEGRRASSESFTVN